MGDEFRLLIDNPDQERRELPVPDVNEARRVAGQELRPGGRAELLDTATATTVWVHDGTTGQELQPGA